MNRYCTISHKLDGLLPDTDDGEVTGHVVFAPVLTKGDAYVVDDLDGEGPVTVVAAKVTARILNGELTHDGQPGVQLFAGGPGSNPEIVRWSASFHGLKTRGENANLRNIIFDAVPGGTINLANVMPPAGAPPVGIMRGEKGDKGDPGPPGPGGGVSFVEDPPGSGIFKIGAS